MAGPRLGLECSGVRDRGPATTRHEDQFLVAERTRSLLVHETSLPQSDHSRIVGRSQGTLLVVATGRGATGAGAVASTVAVEALADALPSCQAAVRAGRADGGAARTRAAKPLRRTARARP